MIRRFNILDKIRKFPNIVYNRSLSSSNKTPTRIKVPQAINSTPEPNPWVRTKDPNGTDSYYYWNPLTNETTPLGSPKPQHWVEVKDINTSSTYWWNVETNETTPLGAAKPSALPTTNAYSSPFVQSQQQPRQTLTSSMGSYFVMGFGMTLGIVMVRFFLG
jgi:hypothetical protein